LEQGGMNDGSRDWVKEAGIVSIEEESRGRQMGV